ncbi:hypothetical protein, partial [Streptomyces sp. NPDC002403]
HPLGLSSGLFPSVLRFRLYQTLSCPIPGRSGFAFQFFAFAFPFPAVPTLPDSFSFRFRFELQILMTVEVVFAFRLIRLYQKHSAGKSAL